MYPFIHKVKTPGLGLTGFLVIGSFLAMPVPGMEPPLNLLGQWSVYTSPYSMTEMGGRCLPTFTLFFY